MGERVLKIHVDPSVVRDLPPELPHGGRPLQYPRLTSCVLTSRGLDLSVLLPYNVVRQLQRLNAGLPLELPILPTDIGAGCQLSGPRDLRSSSTSAFSPVPIPDSTTPPEQRDDVFGLSLQDMVGLDEAADEEVRAAMEELVQTGTAQPMFSPDLECHESSLALTSDQDLPFPRPNVICDACGHSGYSSRCCPRCSMEQMCGLLNGECGVYERVPGRVCLPGSDSLL